MINLLELSKRQILAVSTGAVAIGIAGLVTVGMVYAAQVKQYSADYGLTSNTTPDVVNHDKTPAMVATGESSSAAQATTKPVQPTQTAEKTQPATPAQPNGPGVPATPAQPTKPAVVPGVVDKVKDTVDNTVCGVGYYVIGPGACHKEPSGCPFYEQTEPKGCNPPSDIQCSDSTFTNCWYVGKKAE